MKKEYLTSRLEDKKQVNRLALLFTLTYMISYITRINYGAVISEMEKDTLIARSLLSMALTGSFITYGAGQIISGILGDHVSPKRLVSIGFVATIIMNILIPICRSPYQMLAVWCVNGFAQSFMWPPLVRLMTVLLSEDDYKKTTVKVSWGGSLGTIFVYLVSPVLISVSGWRAVFIFSAVCGAVMLFVWNKFSYEIETPKRVRALQNSESQCKSGAAAALFSPMMFAIMAAIALQGMLRDGVTTWMPSYISETYNLSNVISILTGVILPVFGIICLQVVSRIYRKRFTNPLMCAGVVFAAGAVSSIGLLLLTGQNAAFSVFLSAVLTGCMHGVNLMLVCMIPPYFKKYGNVSTVSGVINSCTYIGSALSTYGIAVLSENVGWRNTLLIWVIIAVSGTAICLISVKPWKKRFG